jgi:hypothetical protein
VTEKLFGHYPMRPGDAPDGLNRPQRRPVERRMVRLRHLGVVGQVPPVRHGSHRACHAAITGSGLETQPQFFEVDSLVRPR